MSDRLHCSFCSRSETDVRRLVAGGGGGHICDACVAIAARIIADSDAGPDATGWWQRVVARIRAAARPGRATSLRMGDT